MNKAQMETDNILEFELRNQPENATKAPDDSSLWESKRDGRQQRQLLELFVRQQLKVALALPILASVFAITNLLWTGWAVTFGWLTSVFAIQGVQLLICKMYLRSDKKNRNVTEWIGMLAASEFLFAAAWSMPLFLFWDSGNPAQHTFIVALLMAVAAGRVMIANNYLPIILAGTGLITVNIVIRCMIEATPFYIGLGAMAFLTEIFFIYLARRLQTITVDMLVFKSEREKLIKELELARAEAEKGRKNAEIANVAKSRFLATMSHELRTPLNAIMGFSEILTEEMMGPHAVKEYKSYSGDIYNSGYYLLHLINDILDLSRIEAGRHEIQNEPVDLSASIDDSSKLLAGKLREKNQTLVVELEKSLPHIRGDERSIRQILINILSNAIKFSDQGTNILVTAKTLPNSSLRLSITDQGPGMSRDEINNVLGLFNRGDLAKKKAIEGSGLGLSIVHGLMKLHGGDVQIKSEPGEGACVSIVFPANRVLGDGELEVLDVFRSSSPSQQALVSMTA